MFVPFAFLLLVLTFNLWIWQIFSINPLVGVVTLATTFVYWSLFKSDKRLNLLLCIGCFIFLLFLQYKTSSITSLTYLTESEKIDQQERLRSYAGKNYIFPLANWLELRKETLTFYKLQDNFSEVVDPNLYFFANHPRERVGVKEGEKFPYILLPMFLLGLVSLEKKNLVRLLLGISPLFLLSIIGNSNPLGPFALFPFFATFSANGLEKLSKKPKLLFLFLILFGLVFIQTLAYAKY